MSPRRTLALLLSVCCTLLHVPPATGLYMYLMEGTSRCFIEEVPSDTLIVGSYKNPDFVPWGSPGFTGSGVRYEVRDPSNAVVKTDACDNVVSWAVGSCWGALGEQWVVFRCDGCRGNRCYRRKPESNSPRGCCGECLSARGIRRKWSWQPCLPIRAIASLAAVGEARARALLTHPPTSRPLL